MLSQHQRDEKGIGLCPSSKGNENTASALALGQCAQNGGDGGGERMTSFVSNRVKNNFLHYISKYFVLQCGRMPIPFNKIVIYGTIMLA
jgi:hypothetical protein